MPGLDKDISAGVEKTLYFQTEQEVTDYCRANGNLKWVVYQGIVYDVADYLPAHPGGSAIIEPFFGKGIDEPFEDQEHT